MKYWFVIHDYSAYRLEPNLIGKEMRLKGKITRINKKDKILYYATGDMVVVNSFDVITNGFEYSSESQIPPWDGINWAYKIRERNKKMDNPVPIKTIVENVNVQLFPRHKFQPIKFKGRTIVEISKTDFYAIENFMHKYKVPENIMFQGPPNEGNLGAPIDLGILNYAPTSEQGVVVLFASFMKDLPHNFVKMEFVRSGFPDACVIQRERNSYSRKYVEFEFWASQFKDHIKNARHRNIKCDYVVCWENDFHTCPIPVIELKSEIEKLYLASKKKAA
jgi:hypothetical protein